MQELVEKLEAKARVWRHMAMDLKTTGPAKQMSALIYLGCAQEVESILEEMESTDG